ncbi:hypothetical protein C2S51_037239 [Perilla frutescens var. frutescens]|nr:hypothetical protein C2S51_037239 [Perilla frutescens var. frutescens]
MSRDLEAFDFYPAPSSSHGDLSFVSTPTRIEIDLATLGKGVMIVFGVLDAHVQGGMVGDLFFMCLESCSQSLHTCLLLGALL